MSVPIKFNKFSIRCGDLKARILYSIDNRLDGRKCVTLHATDFDLSLKYIFPNDYKNDSNSAIDYFDQGRVVLFEDNPHYQAARKAAESTRK